VGESVGPFFFFVTVAMPVLLGPVLVKDFCALFAGAGPGVLVMPLPSACCGARVR